MKALHYITSYFPKPLGAAYAARQLVQQLKARRVDVQWMVDAKASGDWEEGGEFEGIPIRSFTLSQPGKLKKLTGLMNLIRFLTPQRGSIDIVHVHGGDFVTIPVGLFAARWLKAKAMLKITSDGFDTPEGVGGSRHGWFAAMCYRRLDGVVAMASGQAEKTRNWGYTGKLEVIPNGVDTQRFVPLSQSERTDIRARLGIPDDVPVMVYSGWLGEGKGTDVLFQMWRRVRETFPETRLLLIGNYVTDQKIRSELLSCLKAAGFEADVLEHPHVCNAGVTDQPEQILGIADVFIFPSRKEGFGTVQIEAMACGLPCVVTELQGISGDIYPDESVGFRVPQGDWAAGAEKVVYLFSHPEDAKQIGGNARRRAEEVFSLTRVADMYHAFYQRLVK